ncbi:MAG: hypothetical protein ACTSV5_09080 [Promethearchaeota archaeon]
MPVFSSIATFSGPTALNKAVKNPYMKPLETIKGEVVFNCLINLALLDFLKYWIISELNS